MRWDEIWQHLGWPALLVGAVLLAMGVVSLAVFVERVRALRRARASSRDFARILAERLDPSRPEAILGEAARFAPDPLARLVHDGLRAHCEAADGSGPDRFEWLRRDLERRVEEIVADLRRGLPVLASVGSVAPFVGLLGTVLGIISAFRGIAETGSGGLSAVSAGIGEALVQTALGLAVAIPAVLGWNYLSTEIARDELALSHAAGELADRLERGAKRPS